MHRFGWVVFLIWGLVARVIWRNTVYILEKFKMIFNHLCKFFKLKLRVGYLKPSFLKQELPQQCFFQMFPVIWTLNKWHTCNFNVSLIFCYCSAVRVPHTTQIAQNLCWQLDKPCSIVLRLKWLTYITFILKEFRCHLLNNLVVIYFSFMNTTYILGTIAIYKI